MADFFRRWGVRIRLSSAHYPQSNGRAEAAVKSAKRLLRLNTSPSGSLDTDSLSVALLQYLNTPVRGVDKSPAQLATGRQLRDGVPTARIHYRIDQHWRRALHHREVTMAQAKETLEEHQMAVRTLAPLLPGTRVWVQNQMSKVWDRSGIITEALPHRQYTVRLDGSGRLSLRNRKHLKVHTGNTSPARPQGQQDTPAPVPALQPCPAQSTSQPAQSRPQRTIRKPQYLSEYVTS